mmetsp:Transcript_9189/g.22072  ORF Transcript_9189/g.22072 Transcript_9189/m.22072 type:complete len:244 (+) Transcript_9189:136-867(+)
MVAGKNIPLRMATWSSLFMGLFISAQRWLHDVSVQPIKQPCLVLAHTLVQHIGVLVLDAHSHAQGLQEELCAAAKADQKDGDNNKCSVHNQSFIRAPRLLNLKGQHERNPATEAGVPHHEHVGPADLLDLVVLGFETGPLDSVAHPSQRVHGARAGNEQQRNHHHPEKKSAGGLNQGHACSNNDEDAEVSHFGASLEIEINLLSGSLILEVLSAVCTHHDSTHQNADNSTEMNRFGSCKHCIG